MSRSNYLQLAFNHTFADFVRLIGKISPDDQLIVEAGTPLIKREGIGVVRKMKQFWPGLIYADMKIVDGAVAEVKAAKMAGADFVTAVGNASKETLQVFVEACRKEGIKSVIDLINTPNPMRVLWKANVRPDVAMVHRGRDEENSFGAVIQYKNIAKIKGKWDVLIGAAGGIDKRELQSAIFNGADIVVVNLVHKSDPWSGIVVDGDFQVQLKNFLNYVR
ncbi:orotidine 5'-phosphate decarboxylase [Patescibacteria group bacterium]|nr:orotidine 5'-phosphate decarboxylase [Patescibacteria group bacterium]